ncbi:MAG TPA: TlpA disulfide reductase family protein [Bryobacteraceae bacterium]|jgi:thiol-disulfide isomerase/thioredoxin|nr:TlpA disulfide reductase family protein [Bryobacteraceae bacterium]
MTRRTFAALLACAPLSFAAEGDELLGKPAPPLGLRDWINSPPLEISQLRGKVVLLRWWTEGCPYCAATAPALNNLQQIYGERGFEVIGIYHPKPPGKWSMAAVRRAVAEKHFTFPVAIDGSWTALKRWWLTKDPDFTSVSFLLDQNGIVRHVQPGGEYHEARRAACRPMRPATATCKRCATKLKSF